MRCATNCNVSNGARAIFRNHPGVTPVYLHQGIQNWLGEAVAVTPFVQNDAAEVFLQFDITPHQRDFFANAWKLLPNYAEMGG